MHQTRATPGRYFARRGQGATVGRLTQAASDAAIRAPVVRNRGKASKINAPHSPVMGERVERADWKAGQGSIERGGGGKTGSSPPAPPSPPRFLLPNFFLGLTE